MPFANLLPEETAILNMFAMDKDEFIVAVTLMKSLFTPEERINSNIRGIRGKTRLNEDKMNLIKQVIFHHNNVKDDSKMREKIWKEVCSKIEKTNRDYRFFCKNNNP